MRWPAASLRCSELFRLLAGEINANALMLLLGSMRAEAACRVPDQ
jgi:hypothetical protein